MSEHKHGILFHILDVAFNIIVIVAIVAGIRTFLVSPFQVEGHSMDNTLADSEYIVINKLAYYIGNPTRGDVVVFHPPTEDGKKLGKFYVKRVIGLPGDEIIIRDGYVFVRSNNSDTEVQLDESLYLNDKNWGHTYRHPPSSQDTSEVRYSVPENQYFLLGDNRNGSFDSRSFLQDTGKAIPFVAQSEIKGRVWFVALPITKSHALEAPVYDLSGE